MTIAQEVIAQSIARRRGPKPKGAPANVRNLSSEGGGGFRCPVCGGRTAVVDSRPHNESIRRRRACVEGHRFSTREEIVTLEGSPYGLDLKLFRLREMGAQWLKMIDAALTDCES